MTTEKIFSITGKEILKENSRVKNDDAKDQGSQGSTIRYRSGLHIFTILFGCWLAMSMITLIPRHNSIKEPIYWYEIMFPAGLAISLSITSMMVDFSTLMEDETVISIGLYLKVIMAYLLSFIIPYCSCYILWTKILDFNHPMPLVGIICFLFYFIVAILTLPRFLSSGLFEKQELNMKLTISPGMNCFGTYFLC